MLPAEGSRYSINYSFQRSRIDAARKLAMSDSLESSVPPRKTLLRSCSVPTGRPSLCLSKGSKLPLVESIRAWPGPGWRMASMAENESNSSRSVGSTEYLFTWNHGLRARRREWIRELQLVAELRRSPL